MPIITKRQHYVPQFYLRNFTDTAKHLYCYEKKTNIIHIAFPKDICYKDYCYEVSWKRTPNGKACEKFIYTNKIENYFAHFEHESAPIIRDIIKKLESNKTNPNAVICNEKEKTCLISIIANFILRNPAMMNDENRKKEIERLCNKEEMKEIRQSFEKEADKSINPLVEYLYKRSLIDHNYDIGYAKNIYADLLDMEYFFICSEKGKFVTGCCPVMVTEKENKFNYCYLPLTPFFTAVLQEKNEFYRRKRNRIFIIDDAIVDKYNRQYIENSLVKTIISNKEETLNTIIS